MNSVPIVASPKNPNPSLPALPTTPNASVPVASPFSSGSAPVPLPQLPERIQSPSTTFPDSVPTNGARSSQPPLSEPALRSLPDAPITKRQPTTANNASFDSNEPNRFRSLTSPSPGTRLLEGSQNPNIEIQKRAPSEVQVGIPSTITLLVRNIGNATAFDVTVQDTVPRGAKLTRTNPQAKQDSHGNLVWELGQFKAGSEQNLTMEIVPETEGELGSVASVQFSAQASVRTMSTLPKLQVKQQAPTSILGGDSEIIKIDVTNNGTGTAKNVRLEAEIPPTMRHATGSQILDTDGVDLPPGESFQMQLELTAVSAGQSVCKVRAVSDNAAVFESSVPIQVIQPKLELSIEGPRLRYLERQATYKISVQNTGTAMARGIRLTVYLPRGMEFNSAANDGTYFPDQHAVEWLLEELSGSKSATTELSLLPVQEGEFVLRMHGSAERVRADAIDKKVQVEGQSELAFSIEDENDPIERDGHTTYIVKVNNTGTRSDSDIQLVLELPEGASVDQVHAPVNHQASQRQVVFSPLYQLQPRDQQIYRISVKHSREGLHVLRAQLKSKNRPIAVTKEESTEVYQDQ
jgi:uncharacterized repeat protein (TIGR01451 family)